MYLILSFITFFTICLVNIDAYSRDSGPEKSYMHCKCAGGCVVNATCIGAATSPKIGIRSLCYGKLPNGTHCTEGTSSANTSQPCTPSMDALKSVLTGLSGKTKNNKPLDLFPDPESSSDFLNIKYDCVPHEDHVKGLKIDKDCHNYSYTSSLISIFNDGYGDGVGINNNGIRSCVCNISTNSTRLNFYTYDNRLSEHQYLTLVKNHIGKKKWTMPKNVTDVINSKETVNASARLSLNWLNGETGNVTAFIWIVIKATDDNTTITLSCVNGTEDTTTTITTTAAATTTANATTDRGNFTSSTADYITPSAADDTTKITLSCENGTTTTTTTTTTTLSSSSTTTTTKAAANATTNERKLNNGIAKHTTSSGVGVTEASSSGNLMPIIGGVVGCLLFLIAIIVVSCFFCKCCWLYNRRPCKTNQEVCPEQPRNTKFKSTNKMPNTSNAAKGTNNDAGSPETTEDTVGEHFMTSNKWAVPSLLNQGGHFLAANIPKSNGTTEINIANEIGDNTNVNTLNALKQQPSRSDVDNTPHNLTESGTTETNARENIEPIPEFPPIPMNAKKLTTANTPDSKTGINDAYDANKTKTNNDLLENNLESSHSPVVGTSTDVVEQGARKDGKRSKNKKKKKKKRKEDNEEDADNKEENGEGAEEMDGKRKKNNNNLESSFSPNVGTSSDVVEQGAREDDEKSKKKKKKKKKKRRENTEEDGTTKEGNGEGAEEMDGERKKNEEKNRKEDNEEDGINKEENGERAEEMDGERKKNNNNLESSYSPIVGTSTDVVAQGAREDDEKSKKKKTERREDNEEDGINKEENGEGAEEMDGERKKKQEKKRKEDNEKDADNKDENGEGAEDMDGEKKKNKKKKKKKKRHKDNEENADNKEENGEGAEGMDGERTKDEADIREVTDGLNTTNVE